MGAVCCTVEGKIKLMDSFEDAWKVISDYCKSKITDIAYNTWISRIQPVDLDFDNGTAYLLVPNDFHAQTLRRCYMSLLNEDLKRFSEQSSILSSAHRQMRRKIKAVCGGINHNIGGNRSSFAKPRQQFLRIHL